MMTCPQCSQETHKLTIPLGGKLGCPNCNVHVSKPYNVNLGQTADKWIKNDGTVGKITVGKQWEIDNRRISRDDGVTVINHATGKEPQY